MCSYLENIPSKNRFDIRQGPSAQYCLISMTEKKRKHADQVKVIVLQVFYKTYWKCPTVYHTVLLLQN